MTATVQPAGTATCLVDDRDGLRDHSGILIYVRPSWFRPFWHQPGFDLSQVEKPTQREEVLPIGTFYGRFRRWSFGGQSA